jgi:hypothetical protein
MPDMQVPVRFRWKPRLDASSMLARGKILFDDVAYEIALHRFCFGHVCSS